jgi:hypothetical protein
MKRIKERKKRREYMKNSSSLLSFKGEKHLCKNSNSLEIQEIINQMFKQFL